MQISESKKIIWSAILVPIFFGFSFLVSKIGLNNLNNNPIDLISFRFLFAAIIMFILKKLKILKIDLKGKNIKLVLLLAAFYPTLSFIFEVLGINMVTSAEAGIMVSLFPIITTIIAIPILKEYPSKKQLFFIILSAIGVIFINFMQKELGNNIGGYLILLISVFFGAMQGVLSRKASLKFKPEEITYIMIFMGAITFNIISIFNHLIYGDLIQYFTPLGNIKFLLAILYLSVACSVISFFLLNYLYSKLEAFRISVLTNIATIISIIAGVFILKEKIYWFHFIGITIILIGVWGTNYYKDNLYSDKINGFKKQSL